MNILINIVLSTTILFVSAVATYNYVPLGVFDALNFQKKELTFGASVTTIQSTDTLSNSRVTINDNFSAINEGFIDVASTSVDSITTLSNLVSVGTITTGTWSATDIAVSAGGTASSTPFGLLWGDGLGELQAIATGTSAQVLTSTGYASRPEFTTVAVDQTLDYSWTGEHAFARLYATSTLMDNATSTRQAITTGRLGLNGTLLSFPNALGASSSVLTIDANGDVSWITPRGILVATSTGSVYLFSNTTQTIESFSLPAGMLGTNNIIHVYVQTGNFTLKSGANSQIQLVYGGAVICSLSFSNSGSDLSKTSGKFNFYIFNDDATNAQLATCEGSMGNSSNFNTASSDVAIGARGSSAIDSTVNQDLKIQIVGNSTGNTVTVGGVIFTLE